MGTSLLAAIFIVAGAILDRNSAAHYETPTFSGIIKAYATITFAYGGHSAFPTLQHDMRRPQDFWKTVLIAYFGFMK